MDRPTSILANSAEIFRLKLNAEFTDYKGILGLIRIQAAFGIGITNKRPGEF